MKIGIAYKTTTATKLHPAGTTVFRLINHDYGIAADDTRYTGKKHVSVTVSPDGDFPSFSYPLEDLVETPAEERRIMAHFFPQVWEDADEDLTLPDEKSVQFDVTEYILSLPQQKALAIEDDQYESDELRGLPDAPQWVKDWTGPFRIEVRASIRAYFAGRDDIAPKSNTRQEQSELQTA